MCGVAGCYQRGPADASRNEVRQMMAAIGHRGPDARGVAVSGPYAVGVHRLSILDLSDAGNQPFVGESDGASLAYNGELYNYRGLAVQLRDTGSVFRSRCDTEVVFEAFRKWGVVEACRRFNGMFACAFYDRGANELWLARDPLGIKPLYYTMNESAVVFASEIKAILAHPAVSRQPDMSAIFAYLVLQHFETSTPFAGIKALPPGHIMKISGKHSELIRYFDPLDDLDVGSVAAPGPLDRGRWLASLQEAMSDSVRDHLVADVPVAVLCSGGLDSSYVAALANRDGPVPGYVADVQDSRPEAERARRVAAHVTMELRTVGIQHEDYLAAWPHATWFNDVPSSFGSDNALLLIMRQCQQDGIKVILTGEGADELFCGYPWLWQGEYLTHGRPMLAKIASILPRQVRRTTWPLLADVEPSLAREWCFSNVDAADSTRLQSAALFMLGAGPYARQLELLKRLEPVRSDADRMIVAAMVNSLFGHLGALLQRADRMCMAYSIECRVPYLDRRVFDVALNMPLRLRYRRPTGKWALKQVALTMLPADIVHAHKWGFAVNRNAHRHAAWLLDEGVVPELLGWPSRMRSAIIEDLVSAPKPVVLHTLLALELWARIFLRSEDPMLLSDAIRQRTLAASR